MASERKPEPLVSVVMSVFNGAHELGNTLDSVLSQRDCELEVVVVDDGSTDATAALLTSYAERDARVRVFHQAHAGLTQALILGCGQARGLFIARQDAGDLSLPGRFREQSAYLLSHPEVVVVASTVRFMAPGGEWLFDNSPAASVKIELDLATLRTPSLVGTMFRRDAYLRSGGFQKVFVVAQDIDMWLRLDETGSCHGLPNVHYQARMTIGGISSRRRDEQIRLSSLAIECAKRRRAGEAETPLLEAFVSRPTPAKRMPRLERARFNYYVGCCLRANDPGGGRRYYGLALRDNPFHLKALWRYLTG